VLPGAARLHCPKVMLLLLLLLLRLLLLLPTSQGPLCLRLHGGCYWVGETDAEDA